jgi:hypothetical protein
VAAQIPRWLVLHGDFAHWAVATVIPSSLPFELLLEHGVQIVGFPLISVIIPPVIDLSFSHIYRSDCALFALFLDKTKHNTIRVIGQSIVTLH